MRSLVPVMVLASIVGIAAAATIAGAESGLGTDPATFNKQLDAALVRIDVPFLKNVIADDFQFTLANQTTLWTKAQWLDYLAKTKYAARDIVTDQVERHGNVVIATARIRVRYGEPQPPRPSLDQIHLRVYQLGSGGWQLVSMRTIKEEPVAP